MPDNHPRHHPPTRPDGWEIADLVAVGVLDAVTGQPPVPISVWRATDPDSPPSDPLALFDGLTPRVAAILIAIYTDPGDIVLDATADPTVAGAAGAGGRRYLPFTPTHTAATVGGSGVHHRSAGLVLLRWPTPSGDGSNVLKGYADALADHGHTVVILAPPAGGIYRDHARDLIAAAADAGLGYLQHVVVITGTDHGQAEATPSEVSPSEVSPPEMLRPGMSRREHLDLLVLVLRSAPVSEPGRLS